MEETTTTRAEHMAWCKERALELVDGGDLAGALASLASDFQKHPATNDPALLTLAAVIGPIHLGDPAGMRSFVEGFA